MPVSEVDSVTAAELEALMREFPDWKEEFPDIYKEVYPQRYTKLNGKKQRIAAGADERVILKREVPLPETDYQSTFHRHRQYRPRSTKKPPTAPADPNPPPMVFDTNQRREFTPKDLGARATLVKIEEQYERPEGKVEGTSNYQRDFPRYHSLPTVRPQAIDPYRHSHKDQSGKFDSRTTSKEHFKQWVSCPSKPFGELPSFTGSILYPDTGHQMETTTGSTFVGARGKRSSPFTLQGNLKIEGDMDMKTTHKLTFHRYDNVVPAQRIKHKPDTIVVQRGKFAGQSQTKSDFPAYTGGQLRPPKPVEPAPATIDLKFDNRQEFSTEQRREFPGIDIRQHPVVKSCKKEDVEYQPPTVKFETNTCQKLDYVPINVEKAYRPPVRPVDNNKVELKPSFDDRTMNKDFFKKWDTPARIRYGDFHEAHKYIPPVDKFENTTTNQEVFVPKYTPIPKSFKPEERPVNQEGTHDFNTMYRSTFQQPMLAKKLNRKQAQLLLKELRKRKGYAAAPLQYGIAAN